MPSFFGRTKQRDPISAVAHSRISRCSVGWVFVWPILKKESPPATDHRKPRSASCGACSACLAHPAEANSCTSFSQERDLRHGGPSERYVHLREIHHQA